MARLLRRAIRNAVRSMLPTPAARTIAARAVRPVLRRTAGLPGHRKIWTAVQLTVNQAPVRAMAHTWFGAKVGCDLTDMIQQRIFYTGVWEPDVSRLIAARLQPGDTFIDIGANVGYFSLLAGGIVGPAGAVIAIEPWPANCAMLRQNLLANDIRHSAVIEQAIAAAEGTVTLSGGVPGNSGSATQLQLPGASEQVTVRAAPLLTSVGIATLQRASIIKIDIEGAEPAVLRELLSLSDRLSRRLTIVVEVTPSALSAYGWPVKQLVEDFARAGFSAARVQNDYDFDEKWWRFDPSEPARILALDQMPLDRFDLVLTRIPAPHQRP